MDAWREFVEVRREFARRRPRHIRRHIMDYLSIADTARINLQVSPSGGGAIAAHGVAMPNGAGAGLYFSGLPLRLKATPNIGFRFAGWNETSPDAPDSLIHLVTAADTITALFTPVRLGTLITGEFMDRNDSVANRNPRVFALHQNSPNPFNSSTSIRYSLATGAAVTISLYNLGGQKLLTFRLGRQPAGDHFIRWDGKDRKGAALASGLYLYELRAGGFRQVRQMLLLK
jgi:hypothetical protein